VGGAVQCGRGQGNAQQMRTRCEQRTETFGAVRAEDKNVLPARSLLLIAASSTEQNVNLQRKYYYVTKEVFS